MMLDAKHDAAIFDAVTHRRTVYAVHYFANGTEHVKRFDFLLMRTIFALGLESDGARVIREWEE